MKENAPSPKERIVRFLLAYLEGFVELPKAVLATLGGDGLEALIWQSLGVSPDNGWLIERATKKGARLIAKFPYRNSSRLSDFASTFKTHRGDEASVDLFHLDLCGTIEPEIEGLTGIVPLVAESSGKCLAITVADQRRNRSLLEWDKVWQKGKNLLGGEETEDFFSALTAQGNKLSVRANKEGINGNALIMAKQEFGLFIRFLTLLEKEMGRRLVPETIQRFVYHSHIGQHKRRFRMRTYLVRFGETQKALPQENFRQQLVSVWQESRLTLLTKRGLSIINQEKEKLMKQQVEQYSTLIALATAAGGESLKEMNGLLGELESVRASAKLQGLIEQIRTLVGKAPVANYTGDIKIVPAVRHGREQLSEEEVQLALLAARAKGEKAVKQEIERLVKVLGLGRKKNRYRIMGAHMARTGALKPGIFRNNFVMRVTAGKSAQEMRSSANVLSQYYSAITGRNVSVETLFKDAGIID
ncbi:MAG: hypothetical protein Q7S34_02120 [bacterium]|nr:hypothetical protein [bacterium]